MSMTAAQPGTLAGLAGSPPRVLVVDDEQHMCDVCARTLRRAGYEVATATDPRAAVDALRGELSFDLLLTDIKMPAMSGLELAHIARERDPAIAIIIMTGFASMENLHQSVQRGVADFLSKPFELEQLRLAVDQALYKRSVLQDNLRLRALEQIHRTSETLGTMLDLGALTTALLDAALRQTGCRVGFVLRALSPTRLGAPTPSVADAALLAAGQQLALRAMHQPALLTAEGAAFAQSAGRELRVALAAPLRAQGAVNGVLVLCDDRASAFPPGVQEEIALVANYAGSALRNAALYGQLTDAYVRLQELDRLKSEFIAIASHELRTPLSIILGYTMMLRDQQTDEQRNYLLRVIESAKRIKDIVDDMVSLRHLEMGEEQLRFEPCDAGELVAQVADRLHAAAAERRHTVRLELADTPLRFYGDGEKVRLMLVNLLANAIRFTPEGGEIVVRAARTAQAPEGAGRIILPAPPSSPPGPWVQFEVQDNGIGIPEREQARIFDRFYQVADSLTRDHGGTGLGLAVVRELIITLNGMLWLTSAEGQGSTFAFALPELPAERAERQR